MLGRSVVSDSLQSHGLWPSRLLCPWNSPGKNTGGGCHFLPQGIFPLLGSVTCYCFLSHIKSESEVTQSCLTLCNLMDCSLPGSSVHGIFQARVLEWMAISFSRRSSRPRDWTRVSCKAGRCFTVWATWEVQGSHIKENLVISHKIGVSNETFIFLCT